MRLYFCLPLLALALSACQQVPQTPRSSATHLSHAQAQALQQNEAWQLANRLSWGANLSTVQQVQQQGQARWLEQQLQARSSELPAQVQQQIQSYTISQTTLADLIFKLEAQRREAEQQKGTEDSLRKAYQQELNRLAREAANRTLLRDLYSSNQLYEQVCAFWANHFNIHTGKHNLRAMVGDFDEHALRPHALGKFADLLRATVYHPAMLRYLDNEHNAAGRINENYARELLELHTMGVDSGYSQADVQELARILTGVGVNLSPENSKIKAGLDKFYLRRGLFEFVPQRHDFGDKKLLGISIKGTGLGELEQVIQLLARHPATARYISRKLALYFTGETVSEALVNTLSQQYLQSDGEIGVVLASLFSQTEWRQAQSRHYKDARHYLLSSLRLSLDQRLILNPNPAVNWLTQMGQLPYNRQTPDGYSMYARDWNSAAQITQRFDIARQIAQGAPALFKAEGDSQNPARVPLEGAQLQFLKDWGQRYAKPSQSSLSQASNQAEWLHFLLIAPEMMYR